MKKIATAIANTKKPAIAAHIPAVERPHKKLTQIQEEVADLASDLLLNGGNQEDVNLLLTALIQHDWRRKSFNRGRYAKSPEEIDRQTKDAAARWSGRYYRGLAKHWPEPDTDAKEEPTKPAPNTVAEMMRAHVRGSLREEFDEFLTDEHGIESAWLFNQVLHLTNCGDDIVEHFCAVMDTAGIYVRVPWKHRARVEEYVAFLEKEEAA